MLFDMPQFQWMNTPAAQPAGLSQQSVDAMGGLVRNAMGAMQHRRDMKVAKKTFDAPVPRVKPPFDKTMDMAGGGLPV